MSDGRELGSQQLLRSFPLTELGNAERLVADHGRDLRFAPGRGWFAWDGKRWRPDTDGEVLRRMKQTVRAMYRQALDLADPDARTAQAKHALRSESAARLRSAVSLAESELPVIVRAADLDADPLLLCAENGTVDLRTGELREHRREDLLTKMTGSVYDPAARSALWERVLERSTRHCPELAEFLQRLAGYSLTGHTMEEIIAFLHGPTNTAKSTIVEAFKATFGEYAMVADFESFLKRRGDAGVRNDIARLAGARIVFSVEVDEGKQLAEGLLKQLTGGDTVPARFLYHETFEFVPRFTLWLAANERPHVRAEDAAMWRRIVQVPLTEVIPDGERDERVKIGLRRNPEARAAILAWAVQGCLQWQQHGLAVPECVREYTAAYRAEQDPIRGWLADCTADDPAAWTSFADLRASYERWCETNGERPVSTTKLGKLLGAKGYPDQRPRGTHGRSGIRVA